MQDGSVTGLRELDSFLAAHLRGQIARSDALVVKLAFEAACRNDVGRCVRLDEKLYAMKTAEECREGGRRIGRQVLRVVGALRPSAVLEEFSRMVEAGKAWGNHATAFALACHATGVSWREGVQAFLYQAASGIVSAAVRLIPLGHMDGQRAPGAKQTPDGGNHRRNRSPGRGRAFGPSPREIEIRAMQHRFLYTRLFRS